MKNNYLNVLLVSWSWVLAWLLNYIYHPIMIKFLTLEEFWEFWSLVWIFNIFWILIVWFVLFLNKISSQKLEDKSQLKFLFNNSNKIFFIIWFIIYLLFLAFTPIISKFLYIDSYKIVLITWLSIIIWFIWIGVNSILRSIKRFDLIWIMQLVWPLIKLFFWVVLVYLWYWIFWAIWWFILSGFLSFLIGYIYLKRYFYHVSESGNIKEFFSFFNNSKIEIFHFFIVSLIFAILMNIDVILVKNIFDADTAWIYAWISVLWKFLIYLLLSIETVYYWQIMEYNKENLPNHLIINPIVITIVTVILAIVFNLFFWEFILKILKPEFVEFKNIYILNLLYYSTLVFISLFTKILIWWWKFFINYLFLILTTLIIALVYLFWTWSLLSFTLVFLISWALLSLISWVLFYIELKKSKL